MRAAGAGDGRIGVAERLLEAYFLLLALGFALLVPPAEAPDETDHLAYVNFVASRLELPNQLVPEKSVYGQGHQAPLSYLLGAIPVRLLLADHRVDLTPVRNPKHAWNGGARLDVPLTLDTTPGIFASAADRRVFYVLRVMSVLFAFVNVVYVAKIGALVIDDPRRRWLVPLFAATLPQFAFISASISSDVLADTCATLAGYHLLRALRDDAGGRSFLYAGVWVGLGLLAKKTALFLVPAMIAVVLVAAYRRREEAARVLGRGALGLVVAALVAAPQLVRNRVVYGEFLNVAMERATLPLRDDKTLWSPYFRGPFWAWLGPSFVARFGWMNVGLPRLAYLPHALTAVLATVGIALHARRRDATLVYVGIALLFAVLAVAALVFFNLSFTQPQGRYLFPALAFFSALWGKGLSALLDVLSPAGRRVAVACLVAALVTVDGASLLTVYRFYYG